MENFYFTHLRLVLTPNKSSELPKMPLTYFLKEKSDTTMSTISYFVVPDFSKYKKLETNICLKIFTFQNLRFLKSKNSL